MQIRSALLFFAFIGGCLNGLYGQQDSITTLAFGIGGGLFSNQITLSNTLRAEYDIIPINGVQFGASIRYFNNKAVGFVGEINYTEGGWRESIDDSTPDYERKFTYFELQILTQIAIGRKLIRPILQAGPYLSFPMTQEDSTPTGFPTDEYYGVELPFRPNYGLSAGTGLYLALGSLGIQLEGRGIFGFSDLIRSGSFGVATSRRFGLGGRATIFYEL